MTHYRLLPFLCLGLFGCGNKEEDTSFDDTGIETEIDCVELSEEECSANESCAAISGVPMAESDDGTCYIPGESQAYGCISAEVACDTAVLFSFNPDETGLVQFPSSCLPQGWESVELFDFQECTD